MPQPSPKNLHIVACDRELVKDDFKAFDLEIKSIKTIGFDTQHDVVVMKLHIVNKKRTSTIANYLKRMHEIRAIQEAWCEACDDSSDAEFINNGGKYTEMEPLCRASGDKTEESLPSGVLLIIQLKIVCTGRRGIHIRIGREYHHQGARNGHRRANQDLPRP